MEGRRWAAVVAITALVVGLTGAWAAGSAGSPGRTGVLAVSGRRSGPAAPPPGFADTVVFSGLTYPTAMQFAPDGRVFVAEKAGVIKVFDSLSDPTPTVFADFSPLVHDYWDRGLLGLALYPDFTAHPFVYALFTMDAPIGGKPPVYGDDCPDPEGAGCVVGAQLVRLRARGDVMTGKPKLLLEDWCQQYPSHSIGTLAFGPDRALYVGAGDGASFDFADYGQGVGPGTANPCGDPGGSDPTPPTAEGGALRAQDIRTPGDPTTMDGAILRVDPMTGQALPDNPLYGGSVADDDRIIAHGLRNPFRFTVRPGTDQIWIGDVGWYTWEEIDRLKDANDAVVENFGWPCYEGPGPEPDYQALGLDICTNLSGEPGAVTAPLFSYEHGEHVVEGDGCPPGGSSISGMAFYEGTNYPARFRQALFFADHSRACIWVMRPGATGEPDAHKIVAFESGAGWPVDLKTGPDGDVFYVDFDEGQIRRITYTG